MWNVTVRSAAGHCGFLPARRNASVGINRRRVCVHVCLSVCHTLVLYRNGCTDQADFWVQVSPTHATLCFRKIRDGISKIRALLPELFSKLWT